MARALRTANPVWNETLIRDMAAEQAREARTMTISGAVAKTAVLLGLLLAAAAGSWSLAMDNPSLTMPLTIGGAIGGLILVLISVFHPKSSPIVGPLYGIAEGIFLGAISMVFNAAYPGIVGQAVGITFAVAGIMLVLYSQRILRATPGFTKGLIAATGAVCMVYFVSFLLRLFGVSVPYIHGSGVIGILFSLVVVVIASLNLILDFDLIEHGAAHQLPKHMEWFAAIGLMVTLVWMYIEILRLLAKLNRR
ncbi:MAG: Bax inhibitor-1/YccA family protein [Phycisphaerae bacterium]